MPLTATCNTGTGVSLAGATLVRRSRPAKLSQVGRWRTLAGSGDCWKWATMAMAWGSVANSTNAWLRALPTCSVCGRGGGGGAAVVHTGRAGNDASVRCDSCRDWEEASHPGCCSAAAAAATTTHLVLDGHDGAPGGAQLPHLLRRRLGRQVAQVDHLSNEQRSSRAGRERRQWRRRKVPPGLAARPIAPPRLSWRCHWACRACWGPWARCLQQGKCLQTFVGCVN